MWQMREDGPIGAHVVAGGSAHTMCRQTRTVLHISTPLVSRHVDECKGEQHILGTARARQLTNVGIGMCELMQPLLPSCKEGVNDTRLDL